MQKVPLPREHHGNPGLVRCGDDLPITARAAGLDDGTDACPGSDPDTISLGKEGIRREHGTVRSLPGPPHGYLDRCYARWLPGAHADETHLAGVRSRTSPDEHYGVRFHVTDRAPCEVEGGPFILFGRSPRDDPRSLDLSLANRITLFNPFFIHHA